MQNSKIEINFRMTIAKR